MAKAPVPGTVKTRLCPPLTHEGAARLAEAFLLDALAQYGSLPVDVRLYLEGTWAHDDGSLCGASLHAQGPGSLGERMTNACQRSAACGYKAIVIIGTDHPTLPTTWIAQAFACLHEPDTAVIGPTMDGGFYLIGMHPFAPQALEGSFSHQHVYKETIARLRSGWANVFTLPEWYDVDNAVDLARLIQDLATHEAAPYTQRVLCL